MADVLLAHSNHLFQDRKQTQKRQPYPPLQTLLAAAPLRENGFRVALCDVTPDPREEKFEALLASCVPRMLVVCEDDFNFLTKMCLGRNRELSFPMAPTAREAGIPAAVHSSNSSDNMMDYLGAGFDNVLIDNPRGVVVQTAFERHAGELLLSEMASDPGPVRILAAREALRQTSAEVEA
jgi:anaerobic magnesium-protoporphyrin IX monomethyl ester cyclase